MFVWSVHAHPTPSHPFRLSYKYIPILLRYAPILIEFGPCCDPFDYSPSICFPGIERKLCKEDNDIFYMEIEERIMHLISDDDEEELKKKNGAPSIHFPGIERKLSKEDDDIFYMEIEERIMRVISDDDEEEEQKKKNGAPSCSIKGAKLQLFPSSNSFVDASCNGSFDTGMRQSKAPFGCGNWQNSAWATYAMEKVRRSVLASGRNGTGVFIPRYA